jgi:hypothetical protein
MGHAASLAYTKGSHGASGKHGVAIAPFAHLPTWTLQRSAPACPHSRHDRQRGMCPAAKARLVRWRTTQMRLSETRSYEAGLSAVRVAVRCLSRIDSRSMAQPSDDVVLEYRSADGERITHIRSTLVSSSSQSLKALGFLERYLGALPKNQHDAMLSPRAPGWMTEEEAAIHYTACNDMNLSEPELELLSQTVAKAIGTTLLSTFTRSSRSLEAEPWLALAQTERLFARLNQGGAVRVIRRGPNEAVFEVRGGSLYAIPYYEIGHHALLRAAVLLFSKTARARTLHTADREHRTLLSWT